MSIPNRKILRKIKSTVLYIIIIGFIFSTPTFAKDRIEISPEDKTKAVFIFNFTKYIQWPKNDTSKVFIIGVIGNPKILIPLKKIVEIKLVNNRKIIIRNLQETDDIDVCHILYIPGTEKKHLQKILEKTKDKNILTISDSRGFAKKGVAINFVIIDDKIKFEINTSAIDNSNLKVSSQLLKLAILINKENQND